MRQYVIVTMAVAIAIAAIWGTTTRPSQTAVAMASKSIDVMGLMKNAKDLPEEKFDAH